MLHIPKKVMKRAHRYIMFQIKKKSYWGVQKSVSKSVLKTIDGKQLLILPRRADTARYAWRIGWAGEVQHQVTAGRGTRDSSSLLNAAVIHLSLWTLPNLYTIRLYNFQANKYTWMWKIRAPITQSISDNSSWERSYNCRHHPLDFSERDLAWNGTLLSERTGAGTEGGGLVQRGYLFPLAHTPASHFGTGWWERQERREKGLSVGETE